MTDAEELTCAELVELVTEFLEDTLEAHERIRFEQHLSACPHCAAYVEQIRLTVAAAGRLRADELEPVTKASLLHAFRNWHRDSPAESPG
jgi:anti-sigma factor RsiW